MEFFWYVFFGIQWKCGKIGTRKFPNTDTFHVVKLISLSVFFAYQEYIILVIPVGVYEWEINTIVSILDL